MNLKRLLAIAYKEWREILRDRIFVTLAFGLPVILMLIYGYGLSQDVENIPVALLDYDHSALSRTYAYRLMASRYFDFKGYAGDPRSLERLLAANRIRVAIIIPSQFQRNLEAGQPAAVQTLIDGTYPTQAQTVKSYMIAINSAFSLEQLTDYLARTRGLSTAQAEAAVQPVQLQVRYLYNPQIKSLWSLAPKLLSVVLLIAPPFLTALSIVREKENGSIYNIYASAVTRVEFMLGKLLPYTVISAFNIGVLWLIATQLFGAPFKGSLVFFSIASLFYVLCTIEIGMLVSLLVKTQVAATVASVILTIVPAANYSGLLTPIESLDTQDRFVAHLFPAGYYTHIALGSFLKGSGVAEMAADLLILAGYSLLLFLGCVLLFSKRTR